jgi:hypothetical protein
MDIESCYGGRWADPTPINKAQSWLRLVRKAEPAQYEPETGGHQRRFGDVRYEPADPQISDKTLRPPTG